MNNRWCIIAGARSGSTWLENIIYDSMGMLPAKIKLGEYLLQTPQPFDYVLDQSNNIIEAPIGFSFKSTDTFLQQRTDLLKTSNIDQALTMRIFIRPMQLPNFDYANFLSILADRNFKIVSLYRNIFDKSISWYFMVKTGTIHRWKIANQQKFYTVHGQQDQVDPITPTIINISEWESVLWSCYLDEVQRKKMTSIFNCPVINYENMIEDCISYGIEIKPTEIVKTYDISYKDMILNYDELITKYNYYKDKVGYEE